MVELILLTLVIFIGVLWFKKLSSNPEKEAKEVEGNIIVGQLFLDDFESHPTMIITNHMETIALISVGVEGGIIVDITNKK